MNAFALYWRLIGVAIRSEMLYPSSFLLRFGSQFVVTVIEFGGVYVMFQRFGHVRGWGFAEVALFYAIASIAFAIADALSRGFDSMGPMLIKIRKTSTLFARWAMDRLDTASSIRTSAWC